VWWEEKNFPLGIGCGIILLRRISRRVLRVYIGRRQRVVWMRRMLLSWEREKIRRNT
jgi:hypothetical protein